MNNTKKRSEKQKAMFSLSKYMQKSAEKKLAKAQFRQKRREEKLGHKHEHENEHEHTHDHEHIVVED